MPRHHPRRRPQSHHSRTQKHVFIKILLDDVHTTCDVEALLVDADQYVIVVWILNDLRLEDRGIQCHGQTDRMGHDQIFLGDLGGFRTSDTGIFAGFALCIACCKFGKVMVIVTFHLAVKHLRLISAWRWDEFLVHECKDAITDLLEFTFHFLDVLPRV